MPGEIIYLDHAAATPLHPKVQAAMLPFFSDEFFNPSSPYAAAVNVRSQYEAAKQTIARTIGAKADDIIITAGATESINLAFTCVGPEGHVVTSSIEHHAVLASASRFSHSLAAPNSTGLVSSSAVQALIQPNTQLVSVALANNELGTIQPIREISAIIQNERLNRRQNGNKAPIYLHCDASQGFGLIDVNVARLGVDFLTISASKIYGPKQVALLWAASSASLHPVIVGGGQERGLRSGTENVAGVIGFAKALQIASEHRNSEARRLSAIRDEMQNSLLAAFPTAVVSGNIKHRLAGYLHISFPGIDAERILFMLEEKGVCVATGSACAANKGTRSHVLTAIGLAPEVADGSLRITLGRLTNADNTKKATSLLIECLNTEYNRVNKL